MDHGQDSEDRPSDAAGSPDWLIELSRMPERAPATLPPPSFAPGERVGRFELLRELGRGGFGTVFEARDLQLGRLVAIKAMRGRPPDAAEPGWAARFGSEAQAIARLSHQNIVTLFDHGVHRAIPFLVLELLTGETLQERLGRGPLTPAAALEVAVQVVGALVHAHEAGIVHRDLKPSNVFLGKDGVASVLDFGLARVRALLSDGQVAPARGQPDPALFSSLRGAGTAKYMAPEQERGEAEDERTDVYAAGVVLQAMLGGAPAPEAIAAIIRVATAEAPGDRFEGSKALLSALLDAQRGLRERVPGAARSNERLVLGAIAAGLVLGAVALGAAWRQLGIGAPGSTEEPVRASAPLQPAAARLYAEGLAKLRAFECAAARDLLARAVAAEPSHPMVHVALAQALWTLGHEAAARAEAKAALDLSEQSPPSERLLIEGHYWETAGEPDKAAEVYARLFREHPEDAEHGFRLLRAQWRAGKPAAMRDTLDRLGTLPGAADDPRMHEGEARLAVIRGDRRRALAEARALIAKGKAQGAPALVFEGTIFAGIEQWNQADYGVAVASFREALGAARVVGDENGAAAALDYLGWILLDQGRLEEARDAFAAMDPSGGDTRGTLARRLIGLGQVALLRGEVAEARSSFAAAFEASRLAEGRRYLAAKATLGLSRAARASGDQARSQALAEESLAVFRALDWPGDVAYSLSALGAALAARGDFAGARARTEEALSIWERRGTPVEAARCKLALAEVALGERRADAAEKLAREALQAFEAMPLEDDRALAAAVVGEALLALGQPALAAKELGALRADTRRTEVRTRLEHARGQLAGSRRPALQRTTF